MRAHKAIADMTYGLLGRSPDHVASFVTGMATRPSVLGARYADNLIAYYRYMRDNDIYASLCRGAAAGRAQPGILSEAEPAGPDPAGGARGR